MRLRGTGYVLGSFLVMMLILSSYLVASSLNSLSRVAMPGARTVTPDRDQLFGTLVVEAVGVDESVPIGQSQRISRIEGLKITLDEEGSPATRSSLDTNSNGIAVISVQPDNYSLSVLDSRSRASIPVQIIRESITYLLIRLDELARAPLFYELHDAGSSGLINRGDRVFAAIETGGFVGFYDVFPLHYNIPPPSLNSTVFIEGVNPGGFPIISAPDNESITASVIGASANQTVAWLALRSRGTLSLGNDYTMYLVSYTTYYSVIVRPAGR